MKTSAVLFFLGIVILSYAYSLPPYTDEALYNARYMALIQGQTAEFWKLRNEMLTSKYQLQDYGGTLIVLAVMLFFVARKGFKQLRSPSTPTKLLGVALLAPLLTAGGSAFDLLQAFDRGELPHWADSMGIPLIDMPFLFIVLLIWACGHLLFLRGSYRPAPLSLAISTRSNLWLLAVSASTVFLVVISMAVGQYWYAIPGCIWLYFYASLSASLKANEMAEHFDQPNKRSGAI